MIDLKKCMAHRDGEPIFSADLCQEPATHFSVSGRRCARHAEAMKQAMRNPATFANVILGRVRTEEEIARLVVELNS